LPARVTDGGFVSRYERRVLRLAVSASLARRRRALGEDFARSHGESARAVAARLRRADHARRDGRRILQHTVCDQRIEARAGCDLDGLERRAVLRHARQWQDVEERDAEGSAAGRPRAVHRDLATPEGLGLLRGLSLSAGRFPTVYL